MIEMKRINKLGTASSGIYQSEEKYIKKYKLNSEDEIRALVEGSNIISENFPESIEMPTISKKNNNELEYIYEQKKLSPWIEPEWITGLQLFSIGLTILKQQDLLIKNGFSFVDAKPSNYWLAIKNGRLIDLASIKCLTRQNIISFLSDFNKNFSTPLRLEKELNIPVSLYFLGDLQTCSINRWGLIKTMKNINYIKEQIKDNFSNLFSNVISSSSPEFIKFLNNAYNTKPEQSISYKKSKKLIRNLEKQFVLNKPINLKNSNWKYYKNFHNEIYSEKKISQIKDFVSRKILKSRVIDIGSNITSLNLKSIFARVDNDTSICREIRKLSKEKEIILQLDVAKYICNFNDNFKSPLNCLGICKTAILTGLIHHLIIDYGLDIEIFYKNTSLLFDDILLEFPTFEDPMVKLLINKKNEKLEWSWEKNHQPICEKYFRIIKKTNLIQTRFLIELSRK